MRESTGSARTEAVVIETPGAGGYGPPAGAGPRTRCRVIETAGKFTDEYIARNYGVRSRLSVAVPEDPAPRDCSWGFGHDAVPRAVRGQSQRRVHG